jgi:hypothetical protein
MAVRKSVHVHVHVHVCAGSCEPGSRCRPNECIFGSGKPGKGGRDFGMKGYMSKGREMESLVYKQPGNEVDGSYHSKEGSK